ncbi:acyltransferase family protein [Cupriavidus sp. 2TAF22]|uniref:acyltransferase family protein n=1 Tax=unclassified Cupriavidus TaxID=2640874 RepID=UPI003F8E83CD
MTFRPLTGAESDQLDSLRGMSAFAVVVGHANQILVAPASDKLSPLMGLLAQSAVMVFFVLSGFLIGKSVSGNVARHGGTFSLARYLGDRIIRIWPPLLVSLLLIFCLFKLAPLLFPSGTNAFLPAPGHALARSAFISDNTQLLGSALMLNGFVTDTPNANGPLWSLSIEVWYYVLAALLAVPRGWWKLLALPLIGTVIWHGANNEQFLYYLPVWWAGYLLAVLHDDGLLRRAKLWWCAVAVFFAAALWFGLRFLWASYAHDPVADQLITIARFNIAIGFGVFALLALMLQGRIRVRAFARKAARYSYTLYIIHAPLLLFAFGVLQPHVQDSIGRSVLASVIAILGVSLLSIAVSRVVENRALLVSLFFSWRTQAQR